MIRLRVQRLPHGEGLPLPGYASGGAAGLDLPAAVDGTVEIAPGARALIPTGLRIAVPEGHEAQVRPRSGLALRHGLMLPNSPGTIDSDYRGELSVIVMNGGDEPVAIERGMRIAQLLVMPVPRVAVEECDDLDATERGEGGFGSTGLLSGVGAAVSPGAAPGRDPESPAQRDMAGKRAVVTGGTAGIGLETARGLAARGMEVTIVGRDPGRGEAAARSIRETVPGAWVTFERADLSLMSEVRRLTRDLAERLDRLDLLVNNAGAIFSSRRPTAEGLEATFALNHLGVFLLTNLLMDRLEASGDARVVVVASRAHMRETLDFDDLQSERNYRAMSVYSRSKLANVMFAYALDRRLAGRPVTANALHPGVVASRFGSDNGFVFRNVVKLFFRLSGAITVEEGARTSLYAALDPSLDGVGGRYFSECREVPSSPASMVEADQERLWRESEAILERLA